MQRLIGEQLRSFLKVGVAVAVFGFAVPVLSADLPTGMTDAAGAHMSAPAEKMMNISLEAYASGYANVLLMRSHFGVIFAEDTQTFLADEMSRVDGLGLNADIWEKMQRRLQGEIDHFIVELQYVIESDGAVWPEDKPERTYKLDNLAALARIRQDLDAMLANGEDLIVLLQELANINALTEGEMTADSEAFSTAARDELVSSALN